MATLVKQGPYGSGPRDRRIPVVKQGPFGAMRRRAEPGTDAYTQLIQDGFVPAPTAEDIQAAVLTTTGVEEAEMDVGEEEGATYEEVGRGRLPNIIYTWRDGNATPHQNINRRLELELDAGAKVSRDRTSKKFEVQQEAEGFVVMDPDAEFKNERGEGREPLNVFGGGPMTSGQREYMIATEPGIVEMSPSGTFDEEADPDTIVTDLLNRAGEMGDVGAANYNKIREDLARLVATSQEGTRLDRAKRDELVQGLLGRALPVIDTLASQRDQGFSPRAMAALQAQAVDTGARQFDQIEQEFRQQVGRNTPQGLPTATQDLVGSGLIDAARVQQRSAGLNQATLANEQVLQQNRDRALQAATLSGQLMGTAGSIFDPTRAATTTLGGFGQQLGAIGGQVGAQFGALGLQAGLAETMAANDPESMRNILLTSLLGLQVPSSDPGGEGEPWWMTLGREVRNRLPGRDNDGGTVAAPTGLPSGSDPINIYTDAGTGIDGRANLRGDHTGTEIAWN
jgi:hypothetical protein